MPKMVYDEWFGTLTYAQRAAYRKFNVSPMDHNDLVAEFGRDAHAAITKAVRERSESGMYRPPTGRLFGW